jgi:hypothetical protein
MPILFLHDWNSIPGVKPTYLKDHGHTVFNPKLPDDDFDEAICVARASSTGIVQMLLSAQAGWSGGNEHQLGFDAACSALPGLETMGQGND